MVLKPCLTCKHYIANACYRFMFTKVSPVTGKEEVHNVLSAKDQRDGYMLLGACSKSGRFWCPSD